MNKNITRTRKHIIIMALAAVLVLPQNKLFGQQKISFGVHADPLISWFSTDVRGVTNNGARAGFNFGLNFYNYFAKNYSFSTGISLISAGGSLTSTDTTVYEFSNFNATVPGGNPVIYKIQYLSVPLGLKLQTNQIGYVTFFTDLGLDPKVVISSKANIPFLDISGENASKETNLFNLSYHITAGIEYSLGGTTSLVAGIGFDNNFLDITNDKGRLKDKVSHKLLNFRLGINF